MESYETRVRRKFPCPEGYRELVNGEAIAEVYDRISMAKVVVLNWNEDKQILRYQFSPNAICSVLPVWYVAKL